MCSVVKYLVIKYLMFIIAFQRKMLNGLFSYQKTVNDTMFDKNDYKKVSLLQRRNKIFKIITFITYSDSANEKKVAFRFLGQC